MGQRAAGVGRLVARGLPRKASALGTGLLLEGADVGPGRQALGMEQTGTLGHGTARRCRLEGTVDSTVAGPCRSTAATQAV